jgi:hypothetical protein
MTFARSVALAGALIFTSITASADPVGRYTVEGKNPGGGSSYSGTVSVEKSGETYRVVWDVGGTRFIGTGVGNKDFLAVSYRSGNSTGLALYGSEGANWTGIWAYADGRELGAERWTPR